MKKEDSDNKELMLKRIATDGWEIVQHASYTLRNNPDFMRDAVLKSSVEVLQYASKKLLNNLEFMLYFAGCPLRELAFKYASDKLKNHAGFIVRYLNQSLFQLPNILKCVSDTLKNDPKFMYRIARLVFRCTASEKDKKFREPYIAIIYQHASDTLKNELKFTPEAITEGEKSVLPDASDILQYDQTVRSHAVMQIVENFSTAKTGEEQYAFERLTKPSKHNNASRLSELDTLLFNMGFSWGRLYDEDYDVWKQTLLDDLATKYKKNNLKISFRILAAHNLSFFEPLTNVTFHFEGNMGTDTRPCKKLKQTMNSSANV